MAGARLWLPRRQVGGAVFLECVLMMLGINSDTIGSAFGVSSPVSHPFDGHQSALEPHAIARRPSPGRSVIPTYNWKSGNTGLHHRMVIQIRDRPVHPNGGS